MKKINSSVIGSLSESGNGTSRTAKHSGNPPEANGMWYPNAAFVVL
ncbi:hypothetical protein [Microvirga sp. Mcv34]|nr:hypothetical protein [Microvirga sp. Mcv34]